MSRLGQILDRLVPDVQTLTVNSNWASGYVRIVRMGNIALVCVMNLRRAAATSNYIDVAEVPTGITLGSLLWCIPLYQSGESIKLGGFRVSNGSIQFNSGTNAPNYGVYCLGIYTIA